MYILRHEPSGLGNVFLDCQQVSDQPHAELQGNSPPGNKIQTHTKRKKKPTNNNLHGTLNSYTWYRRSFYFCTFPLTAASSSHCKKYWKMLHSRRPSSYIAFPKLLFYCLKVHKEKLSMKNI